MASSNGSGRSDTTVFPGGDRTPSTRSHRPPSGGFSELDLLAHPVEPRPRENSVQLTHTTPPPPSEHLSLESLAAIRNGDAPYDTMLVLLGHAAKTCPDCGGRLKHLSGLEREADHYNPTVALEMLEAEDLFSQLVNATDGKVGSMLAMVVNDPRFQIWGLSRALVTSSGSLVTEDPGAAAAHAAVAIAIAERLDVVTYDAFEIAKLRAQAYSRLGNALRAKGDLFAAEQALQLALATAGLTERAVRHLRGEVLSALASLRRAQRRFPESRELLKLAEDEFRQERDPERRDKGLLHLMLKTAKVLEELQEYRESTLELLRAFRLAKELQSKRYQYIALFNLAAVYQMSGDTAKASRYTADAIELAGQISTSGADLLRLKWQQANLLRDGSKPLDAELTYKEVYGGFVGLGLPYDAALVSLDLAELLVKLGRGAEVASHLSDVYVYFRSAGVEPAAIATLYLTSLSYEHQVVNAQALVEVRRALEEHRAG